VEIWASAASVASACDSIFAPDQEVVARRRTVRLDMNLGPDTPPYDHPLVAGENAAADLFADLFLK
jgi:hypothetical protein